MRTERSRPLRNRRRTPVAVLWVFILVGVVNLLATAMRAPGGAWEWSEWIFWSSDLVFAVGALLSRRRASAKPLEMT